MSEFMIQPVSTGTAMRTATQGIERGIARADSAARAVADSTAAEPADLAAAAVEMRQAKNDVAANARVLRTADEMIGTLIDLRA